MQALSAAGATGEVVQLLREAAFPVRKEAAFVIANICAGTPTSIEPTQTPILASYILPVCPRQMEGDLDLIYFSSPAQATLAYLDEQSWHKQGILAAGGGDGSGDQQALQSLVGSSPAAVQQGALPAMMELLTCPDPEAAFLALQFVEMVLRVLLGGPQIVEAADGILALEDLQMKCVLRMH